MPKKKHSYKEIIEAKELLGLPSLVTREYAKKRYAELAKKHHPDSGAKASKGGGKMREISAAYRVIEDYMNNYRYSFSKAAVSRYNPEAGSSFREYNDPVWGSR